MRTPKNTHPITTEVQKPTITHRVEQEMPNSKFEALGVLIGCLSAPLIMIGMIAYFVIAVIWIQLERLPWYPYSLPISFDQISTAIADLI